MDRLTIPYPDGAIELKCSVNGAVARLAAYEDTGLEPEEITKLAALAQNGQSAIDTNARLLKAQNEGRLIVLPSEYDPEIIAWMQAAWERFLKEAEAALGGDGI